MYKFSPAAKQKFTRSGPDGALFGRHWCSSDECRALQLHSFCVGNGEKHANHLSMCGAFTVYIGLSAAYIGAKTRELFLRFYRENDINLHFCTNGT